MFYALRGGGAHVNRRPLRVSEASSLSQALLVTGFPYDVHDTLRDNVPQFAAFLRRARAVRRDGSAALNLSYLAAGRFDGFWEEGLAPWDVAAGRLLVEEAGGRITGYHGDPFDLWGGNLAASNGRFHAELVAILEEIERRGDLPPLETRRRTRP